MMLICFFTFLSANPTLSRAEQRAIDDVFDFSMQISTLPFQEGLNSLSQYRTVNCSPAKTAGFSEETKLILDAVLDLSALTFYQADNSEDPQIQIIAEKQYKKLQNWIDNHKNETPNKWTYCLAAEAFDWYLVYLPIPQILAKGLLPKTYYLNALEQDPDMSYALCGLAQWLYYAPGIVGGGKKAACNYLEKSVNTAQTNADRYFSHLFYSQILFELKDTKGADQQLAAAETVQPGSRRITRFRQMNALGYSWFEFARDFEENRAKLSEPLVN